MCSNKPSVINPSRLTPLSGRMLDISASVYCALTLLVLSNLLDGYERDALFNWRSTKMRDEAIKIPRLS